MAKSTPASKATKKSVAKKSLTKVAKKAAPHKKKKEAKPEKKERSINLKYADKSAGQPEEMLDIFEAIKKLMLPYDKKRELVMHMGTIGQANLVSHKPVVIAGRPRQEVWFVSALVQKGYVGFYYMPVYMNEPMKKLFSPEFIKCLKGKACFHIKKNDPAIMAEIKKAIQIGYEAYEKRGWL